MVAARPESLAAAPPWLQLLCGWLSTLGAGRLDATAQGAALWLLPAASKDGKSGRRTGGRRRRVTQAHPLWLRQGLASLAVPWTPARPHLLGPGHATPRGAAPGSARPGRFLEERGDPRRSRRPAAGRRARGLRQGPRGSGVQRAQRGAEGRSWSDEALGRLASTSSRLWSRVHEGIKAVKR